MMWKRMFFVVIVFLIFQFGGFEFTGEEDSKC
jgi:hypothetical protein